MALTQSRLNGPTQLTTASSNCYTVSSGVTTIVKQIILTNTSASAKTATVRLVPSGGSDTSVSDILSNTSISANETIVFNCSMVMTYSNSAGDRLTALVSANSAVNITIFGIEEV
jgi:hypothetical protein